MRNGEYCQTQDSYRYHPFCFCNITFHIHNKELNNLTTPTEQLMAATRVTVKFNHQKNSWWGEEVIQGSSGNTIFCPCRALAWRILHLECNNAPLDTPIEVYYQAYRSYWKHITSKAFNVLLRCSCDLLPHLGHSTQAVTTRALQASGAMALMCAQVDLDHIKLLGRWQSDAPC
jgi:hypothetical protein